MKDDALKLSSALRQLFVRPWDQHNEEERALHAYLMRVDMRGLALMALLYAAASAAGAPALELPPRPSGVVALHALMLALALHNLYMSLFVVIKVTKTMEEAFGCSEGPLGRFIWITNQTIFALAVHTAFSLVSPLFSTRLALVGYRLALPLAGVGAFVTIQFFTLVFSEPQFAKECKEWAPRGVHHKLMMSVLHMPQLVLALLDVCVLKHRATLLAVGPSALGLVLIYTAYCSIYVSVVHANRAITGHWPYGILAELGSSVFKWAQFMVVQTGILWVFGAALWALAHFSWAFW